MKKLLVMLLLLCIPFTSRAQSTCDLTTVTAYEDRIQRSVSVGDYTAAEADYTCALALDADNADLLAGRALVYFELEQWEDLLADATRAIELGYSDTAQIYNLRGIAHLGLYAYEAAEADFVVALENEPDNGPALNNYGNVYYEQGDYDTALEYYTRAITSDRSDTEIPYYNRGLAYYELGRYDEALAEFEQSIDVNPEYAYAYLALGGTYAVLGDARTHENFLRWLEHTETSRMAVNESLGETVFDVQEGDVFVMPLTLAGGEDVYIAVRGGGETDPLAVLLDPSGEAVASDDDTGLNLDAVISGFVAPSGGSYTLLVGQSGLSGAGALTLTVGVDGEVTRQFTVYRLIVGNDARIFTTEGDNLNVRSGPGLNFDIVDRLPSGTTVTLMEGPRKADGLAWWRIRTAAGLEGWSVELVDEEQTLQPALVIGQEALVYTDSGDSLNLREAPGRANALVTQLAPGTVVTVLEGPIAADEYQWWHIRTADGLQGWAVDRVAEEQTLVGFPPDAEE